MPLSCPYHARIMPVIRTDASARQVALSPQCAVPIVSQSVLELVAPRLAPVLPSRQIGVLADDRHCTCWHVRPTRSNVFCSREICSCCTSALSCCPCCVAMWVWCCCPTHARVFFLLKGFFAEWLCFNRCDLHKAPLQL